MIEYDRQRGTNIFYQFITLATSNQAFANFNIFQFLKVIFTTIQNEFLPFR